LIGDVTDALEQYRLSEVGERLYDFVWSQYCDWYLELSKEKPNVEVLLYVLRRILLLLHPYAPFVTEEIWAKVGSGQMLMKESWPSAEESWQDALAESQLQVVVDVVTAIRKMRSEQGLEERTKVDIVIHTDAHLDLLRSHRVHIMRLANVRDWTLDAMPVKHEKVVSTFLKDVEVHIPIAGVVNLEKLQQEQGECARYRDGLKRELENQGFLKRAPAKVVEEKRSKLQEAEERLRKLEERLGDLS